jgi:hypothetical protein
MKSLSTKQHYKLHLDGRIERKSVNPKIVRAAIIAVGTTQRAIATHLGVTQQSLGRVISGSMRSAKIEAELEKVTGIKLYDAPARRGRVKNVWTGTRQASA